MKSDIHPDYRFVVFKDISTDFYFLTKSDASSGEEIKWKDGNTYALVKIDMAGVSYPPITDKISAKVAESKNISSKK